MTKEEVVLAFHTAFREGYLQGKGFDVVPSDREVEEKWEEFREEHRVAFDEAWLSS